MDIRIFWVSLKLGTLNPLNIDMSQNNVPFTQVRPLSVEGLVIFIFYVIFLMPYAVIINYFGFFFSN